LLIPYRLVLVLDPLFKDCLEFRSVPWLYSHYFMSSVDRS
jgi:hypothetical protein